MPALSNLSRRAKLAAAVSAALLACAQHPPAASGATATWLSPVSGNWTDGTKWSTNPSYPGTGGVNEALLNATGGTHTVTFATGSTPLTLDRLTLASPAVTLNHITGTLNVPQLKLDAGTYQLSGVGRVVGATIDTSGGGQLKATGSGGTLEQATLGSDLALADGTYTFTGGLNLDGHDLNVRVLAGSFSQSTALFSGAQTIGGSGRITLGGTSGNARLYVSGGPVTIGPDVTLSPVAGAATTTVADVEFSNGSLVNNGTIAVSTPGKLFGVYAPLTNNALIEVTGGSIDFETVTDNVGTIRVTNAGFSFNRFSANNGTVRLENASVALGDVTTAVLNTFQRIGGSMRAERTLDNRNDTLDLDHVGPLNVALNGTVLGGSLHASDRRALQGDGTLSGVTLLTPVEAVNNFGKLNNVIFSGIDYDLINTTGFHRWIGLSGTLGGSGRLRSLSGDNSIEVAANTIIDSGITIVADSPHTSLGAFAPTPFALKGDIDIAAGRTLFLGGAVTSTGTIRNNGGTLILAGGNRPDSVGNVVVTGGGKIIYAGTLANTGSVLDLATTPLGAVDLGAASITGGTLTSTGRTLPLHATSAAASSLTPEGRTRLSGVTVAADVDFLDKAYVSVTNNLTLAGGATLNLDGGSNIIEFAGPGAQSITGTGQIVLNKAARLQGSSNDVTIGAGITVRTGSIGGTIGDDFINAGAILSGTAGGVVSIGARFDNLGTIEARDGGTITFAASMNNSGQITVANGSFANVTGPMLNSGTFNVFDSTLELRGNVSAATVAGVTMSNSTLRVAGTWSNVGATLPVTVSGQRTLQLVGTAKIDGGTIAPGSADAVLHVLRQPGVIGTQITTISNLTLDAPLNANEGTTVALNAVANRGVVTADKGTVTLGTGWSNTGSVRAINGGVINVPVAVVPNLGASSVTDSTLNFTSGTFNGSILGTAGVAASNATFGIGTGAVYQNAGGTLDLAAAGPGGKWLLSGGRIVGGTVSGVNAAPLGRGTIDGVTIAGSVGVTDFVNVSNGVTVAGGAILHVFGTGQNNVPGRLMLFPGAQTFSGQGEIVLDHVGGGALIDPFASTGFVIGQGVTLRSAGQGPDVSIGLPGIPSNTLLTNRGTISAGGVQSAFVINMRLLNEGLIEARNGASLWIASPQFLTNNTLSGGRYEVHDGSQLQVILFGGALQTNAAQILLDGPTSRFDALSGLKQNTGSLTLAGGRDFVTAAELNNSGTIRAGAGSTFTVTGPLTWSGGAIDGAGVMVAPSAQITGDVIRSGGGVSGFDALDIAAGKRLDLTNGKLITREPIGSATTAGGAYDGVQGLVQSAYNFTAWDGPGILTSMPDAQADRGITTLAVATADEVFYAGGTFGGVSVSSGDVLVMYTYAGDLNMDGLVDGADYGVIDNYVQFPGTDGYANGDFNYDGIIDGADYGVIDNTIQLQGEPFASGTYPAFGGAGVTTVPEPAGGVAVLFAVLVGAVRRRRRRHHG